MLLVRKAGFVLSVALGALVLMMSDPTRAAISGSAKSEDEDAKKEIMAVLRVHEEYWNRHDMDTWADKILHEDSDWVNWRGGIGTGRLPLGKDIELFIKLTTKTADSVLSASKT